MNFPRAESGLWLPDEKPSFGDWEINPYHPLSEGLVACWLMNEYGNILFDLTDNDNNATLYGPIWGNGGLRFNGTSDYGSIGDVPSLQFSDGVSDKPFSIVSEIHPLSSVTHNPIISKYENPAPFIGEWRFDLFSDNTILFVCYDSAQTVHIYVFSSFTIADNERAHVVSTYDGSGSQAGIEVYKNGILDLNPTRAMGGAYVAMNNTNSSVEIGAARRLNQAIWFDGYINYNYIYNLVLTPEKVTQLHADPYCFLQPKDKIDYFFMPLIATGLYEILFTGKKSDVTFAGKKPNVAFTGKRLDIDFS